MFGAGGAAQSFQTSSHELDRYAHEFATLVEQYRPRRGRDQIVQWIRELPDEVFRYYRMGIASYGSEDLTTNERRGRLYLTHTALLFMWMTWGKDAAKERFRSEAREGTRRAASLIQLEQYRRAGVIRDYELDDWYWQPVANWSVTVNTGTVDVARVSDVRLATMVRTDDVAKCPVDAFTALRTDGAVPPLHALPVGPEDAS